MKLEMIAGIFIFLIVSLPLVSMNVYGQVVSGEPDDDNDGVCNWAGSSDMYEKGGYDRNRVRCHIDPSYGDICPGTRPDAGGVKKGGIYNGCAPYQLETFRNYWSASLGKSSPESVKVNWLLDQSQGVEFYQEVLLTENIGIGEAMDERPEISNVRFECDRGKGIVLTGKTLGTKTDIIEGNYGSVRRGDYKKGEKKATMILRLNQQSEDKVRTKPITDIEQYTIDEIEFNCEAIISQCVNREVQVGEGQPKIECIPIYPEERESFKVRVAIDTLVIQPPEAFLDRGVDIADSIIGFTDSVIPKLEWAYRFAVDKCVWAIKIVLAGKFLGIFVKGFSKVADFIWYGPEKWGGFSLTSDAFFISGRSMCSYSVCPKSWCRLANWEVGTKDVAVKEEDPATGKVRDVIKPIPIKMGDNVLTIQDSLMLSVGCGCISGMVQNLYRLRAIAQNWKNCLELARSGGVYTSDCERVLQQNICEFVVKEWAGFQGTSLSKKLLGPLWDKLVGGFGVSEEERLKKVGGAVPEAGDAQAQISGMQSRYEQSRHFGRELFEIGSATGRGFMGYEEQVLLRTFCNLAVYGKIPEFIRDVGLDVNKVHMSTTVSGNWRAGIAYSDIEGKPIYGYDISWMIIAGRENMRYSVYLKNIDGGKRFIDRKTGFLRNIGDFDSDYMQITDEVEYVELCIEIPNEPSRSGCYPPGKFATGGIIKDIDILFGEDEFVDSDKDRLPDEWEKKYNCYPGRQPDVSFTKEDKADCDELISESGRNNLLNPNNPDSDGDGVRDDKEDPDGDGLDNYQEFLQGGNPNHAKKKADGSFVEGKCDASFESFDVVSGQRIDNGQMKFGVGEEVKIKLNGVGVEAPTKKEEVVVKTTITGRNEAYVSNIILSEAGERNIIVWKVPDDVKTGEYNLKVELVKLKDVAGSDMCTGKDGRVARRSRDVIVVNTGEEGCWDTDGGNNIGENGVCIDTSIHAEICNGNQLREYVCEDKRCKEILVDCRSRDASWTCVSPGFCGGVCFDNDVENNPYFAGACKDQEGVKFDKCSEDGKVIEFECSVNGVCTERDPMECGVEEKTCELKSLYAVFSQLDQRLKGNIGVCVDKRVITTPTVPPESGTDLSWLDDLSLNSNQLEKFNIVKKKIYDNGNSEIYREVKKSIGIVFSEEEIPLILAMITQESGGNKTAGSLFSAYGLMQVKQAAQQDVNEKIIKNSVLYKDRTNWQDNIFIGINYLKLMYDRFKTNGIGDFSIALAAYNAGPSTVESLCKNPSGGYYSFGKCKAKLPLETQEYVPLVFKYRKAWEEELKKVPA